VTWQQLKDAFREFGPISRADVPQDETVLYKIIRKRRLNVYRENQKDMDLLDLKEKEMP